MEHRRSWTTTLDGVDHRIELVYRALSGWMEIEIDGVRQARGWREWQTVVGGANLSCDIGTHRVDARVTQPFGHQAYAFALRIDGQLLLRSVASRHRGIAASYPGLSCDPRRRRGPAPSDDRRLSGRECGAKRCRRHRVVRPRDRSGRHGQTRGAALRVVECTNRSTDAVRRCMEVVPVKEEVRIEANNQLTLPDSVVQAATIVRPSYAGAFRDVFDDPDQVIESERSSWSQP